MFCERPANADAAMKITMPAMKNSLRPYISPSLPTRGTVVVEVSM